MSDVKIACTKALGLTDAASPPDVRRGLCPAVIKHFKTGFALGPGYAPRFLGRRPNERHSRKGGTAFSARHSLRRTSGGEAAANGTAAKSLKTDFLCEAK